MAVGLVVITALASCSELRQFAPLELQPPPREPSRYAFDLGRYAVACLSQGQIVRFIVIGDGDSLVYAECGDPPAPSGRKS